jgi:hypothetical protein
MPSLKIHAYGHETSWWSGTTDENVKALSTDSTLRIDRDECNVLAEVQCLMAFLDRTDRAYGSVDALADLQKVRRSDDSSSFLRAMQAWSTAAISQDPSEQLTQVFTSTAVKDDGSGRQEENMVCVEPYINPALGQTLVDILDTTVWDDERGNIDDVWIDHAAEIFTIRIRDPNPGKAGLNLNLDPVWYPDRYMHKCREATMQIRKQLQHIRREIEQCTAIQRRWDIAKVPDNRVLMTREVLDAAAKASAGVIGKKSSSHGLFEGQGATSEDTVSPTDVEEVRQELQSILQRIEQKSQQLEQRKAGLRLTMRQIASQLTRPTPESPDLPRCKYILQGVSTKPNITYVRRPSQDLLHLDDEESSSEDPESQWWKMAWLQDEDSTAAPVAGPITREQAEAGQHNALSPSAAAGDPSRPYTVLKVTEKEVLEAVRSEHQSVLLVYANANAMMFKGSELSLPLRRFVERDNQAFSEELREEESTPIDESGDGEAEAEFEDVPLIDQTGSSSSVREFTPVSTSSPGVRDEDGQPSPKRAKEGNGSYSELPPSYEDSVGKPEMQERKVNKIGLYSEQMLQKYGGDVASGAEDKNGRGEDLLHIEHSG